MNQDIVLFLPKKIKRILYYSLFHLENDIETNLHHKNNI